MKKKKNQGIFPLRPDFFSSAPFFVFFKKGIQTLKKVRLNDETVNLGFVVD